MWFLALSYTAALSDERALHTAGVHAFRLSELSRFSVKLGWARRRNFFLPEEAVAHTQYGRFRVLECERGLRPRGIEVGVRSKTMKGGAPTLHGSFTVFEHAISSLSSSADRLRRE